MATDTVVKDQYGKVVSGGGSPTAPPPTVQTSIASPVGGGASKKLKDFSINAGAIPAETLDETSNITVPDTTETTNPQAFVDSLNVIQFEGSPDLFDPQTGKRLSEADIEQAGGFGNVNIEKRGSVRPGVESEEDFSRLGGQDLGTRERQDLDIPTEKEQDFNQIEDERDEAIQDIRDASENLLGQGTREQELLNQFGFSENLKDLQDINLQIAQLKGEFDKMLTDSEGRPVAMGFIRGEQAQIMRQRASAIGALTSVAQALQGNVALAEQIAEKTVELEFADAEQELENALTFLDLNEDEFTRAEKKLADERKEQLEQEKAVLESKKEERENILEIAQDAAKGGATSQNINAILKATSTEEALSMATPFLKNTKSSSPGTQEERFVNASREAISIARQELNKTRGEDGFVDPNTYMSVRTDFAETFGATRVDEFDDVFVSELSPEERARLGIGKATGVKASQQASQEDIAFCNYAGGTMVNGTCQF